MASVASLIIANMTDEDFDRFQADRIGFSGSTGKGRAEGYGELGPYIATYVSELQRVIHALGWSHVTVNSTNPHQWVMRRAKVEHPHPHREPVVLDLPDVRITVEPKGGQH